MPIYIDKKSESLRVIQYLRNEAHRFGITHHRNKRSKASLISEITQIEGIGPKTHEDLMKSLKTISAIRDSSLETLQSVIGKAKGKIVYDYFK